MKKTRIIGLIVVAALALGVAAYVFWPRDRDEQKVVRFGSFSVAVDYSAYLVAKDKGWFEEALKAKGMSAEYTTFQSLPPINESLATGRVDIIFEAEPPAIAGRAADIDIRIVGISCSVPVEVLVPNESTAKSIVDLKGKKVAVLAGTSSHYGLLKTIEEAGMGPKDIEIIDMTPPDAKSAFQTRKIDGWAIWSPWIEQEELAGTGKVIKGGNAMVYSIMAARGEFAKKHPEALREIVQVLNRSRKWVKENPKEAQQIAAKAMDVKEAVVEKAWPRHNWEAQITDAVIVDFQAKADFLQTNKFIRKTVNVRDMFDLSFSK